MYPQHCRKSGYVEQPRERKEALLKKAADLEKVEKEHQAAAREAEQEAAQIEAKIAELRARALEP